MELVERVEMGKEDKVKDLGYGVEYVVGGKVELGGLCGKVGWGVMGKGDEVVGVGWGKG